MQLYLGEKEIFRIKKKGSVYNKSKQTVLRL